MTQSKKISQKELSIATLILVDAFPDLTSSTLMRLLISKESEVTAAQTGRLLTYTEAAQRWSCSKRHIQYLCEKGELPTIKIGPRAVRIPESALDVKACRG